MQFIVNNKAPKDIKNQIISLEFKISDAKGNRYAVNLFIFQDHFKHAICFEELGLDDNTSNIYPSSGK